MIRSVAVMGTIVTIHVAGPAHGNETHDSEPVVERAGEPVVERAGEPAVEIAACIERAFDWFRRVEGCCTRFDPSSELMQLTSRAGLAVPVSELLFEAVRFAIAVSEESGGAFDPTVGHQMERRGFNREYSTGRFVETDLGDTGAANFQDVLIDDEQHTITLCRPLVLDLGGVAKGMAVDLAARELRQYANFAIDAGGDLYLAGCGPGGAPWSVGIRHPRLDRQLIEAVRVSNMAVCTSGDYERLGDGARLPNGSPVPLDERPNHHILDPRTGASVDAVASVTVLAPTAMVADALATAAFVLGPAEGIPWLERQGVEGLIFSTSMARFATKGMGDAAAGRA